MITLKEAMKLLDIEDDEICYLVPQDKKGDYMWMSGKQICEQLYMKKIKVYGIKARFEKYGYLGMELRTSRLPVKKEAEG